MRQQKEEVYYATKEGSKYVRKQKERKRCTMHTEGKSSAMRPKGGKWWTVGQKGGKREMYSTVWDRKDEGVL